MKTYKISVIVTLLVIISCSTVNDKTVSNNVSRIARETRLDSIQRVTTVKNVPSKKITDTPERVSKKVEKKK